MLSKSDIILQQLQQELQAGKFPVGSRFPSTSELALRFNINRTTAHKLSLILLNRGILRHSESTRAGLIVSAVTPAETMPKIALIGSILHPFFARITAGFLDAAAKNNIIAMPFNPEFKQLDSLLRKLETNGFQGIATYSFGRLNTTLPVVYLEPEESNPPAPSVASDSRSGGKLIIDALKNAGHKEIVFCFNGIFSEHRSARIEGMLKAAYHAGWHDAEKRIFWYHSDSILRLMREMATRFPGFTAIAADSDDRVIQLIRTGRQLGLPIPEKIIACGFGNVEPIHRLFQFPSIEQHPFDVGVCGCETLLKIIAGETQLANQHIKIDVELLNSGLVFPH
ncbi:MAG: substrate-binding domain-containing protein [Lentisphaeria bacterium]|nr:substrate-binding domain-containing protein [Lentisphaeria bacterium]